MNKILQLSILLLASMLGGCGLAAKTAYDTARGGYSQLSYVEPVQSLSSFESLAIEPFSNSAGDIFSAEDLARLNESVHRAMREQNLHTTKNGSLRVFGTVLHADDKTLSNRVIVRVSLEDKPTGNKIGIVNIVGKVGGVRGFGESIDAVAEGVVRVLKEHRYARLQ